AHGGDVAADELHRVVDRHAGGDRATGAVDVQPDVLLLVLALEVEQLGAQLVGDVVVDGGAEQHDAVLEQAVEDVRTWIERGVEHVGRGCGHDPEVIRTDRRAIWSPSFSISRTSVTRWVFETQSDQMAAGGVQTRLTAAAAAGNLVPRALCSTTA